MNASLLYPAQCFLGEGPVWHPARESCFWVDIERGNLYELKWFEKTIHHWSLPHKVTLALPAQRNKLIVGVNTGIAYFDLTTGVVEWLKTIEDNLPNNRCNDGACDTHGRLWIGTMDMNFTKGSGALYCVSENLKVDCKVVSTTISNGIAWSLDNKLMYFIDSGQQHVQCFAFDEETGAISFEKNAITIPEQFGTPDGMAVDAEGMLWIALWGGFGVYRYNPFTGAYLEKISVPAPNVSSCAFAGPDLDHLIITTARQDLSPEALQQYPNSGDVFYVPMPIKGRPDNKCVF